MHIRACDVWFAWLMILLVSMSPTAEGGSSEPTNAFEGIPRSHWAYVALDILGGSRSGIAVSYSMWMRSLPCFPSSNGAKYDLEHRTLTRYEFAVVTLRTDQKLAALEKTTRLASQRQTVEPGILRILVQMLKSEFSPELTQLEPAGVKR